MGLHSIPICRNLTETILISVSKYSALKAPTVVSGTLFTLQRLKKYRHLVVL